MTSPDAKDDVVERVARAICGPRCDAPKCSCQPTKDTKALCWKMSVELARRAIRAMPGGAPDALNHHPSEGREGGMNG